MTYPDVVDSQFDAVDHYIRFGWKEGRDPSRAFSTKAFLASHGKSKFGFNPLADAALRRMTNSAKLDARFTSIVDTLSQAGKLQREISYRITEALLDKDFYLNTYQDVQKASVDPVSHYMHYGWHEMRNPSPVFSTKHYVEQHALANQSGNPLIHRAVELLREHGKGSAQSDASTPNPSSKAKVDTELDIYQFLARNAGISDEPTLHKRKALIEGKPVVFLVFFCQKPALTNLQRQICEEYLALGVNVVAILNQTLAISPSDARVPDGVQWVVTRKNAGFDFGAWTGALELCGDMSAFPRIILTNDSLIPLSGGIEETITALTEAKEDWCFSTANHEIRHHGQSFLMSFNPAVLGSKARELLTISGEIRHKQDVIDTAEVPLMEKLIDQGFSVGFLCDERHYAAGKEKVNPTLHSAEELIAAGFRFVKAEYLLDHLGDPLSKIGEWFDEKRLLAIKEHMNSRYPKADDEKQIVHAVPKGQLVMKRKIVLLGHNAGTGGAQTLLLSLAKILTEIFGYEILIILHDNGPDLSRFQAIAPTFVLGNDAAKLAGILAFAQRLGFEKCIINTTVPLIYGHLIYHYMDKAICLVHELPETIEAIQIEKEVAAALPMLDQVVMPANFVRDRFVEHFKADTSNFSVLPQGHFRQTRTFGNAGTTDIDMDVCNQIADLKAAGKTLILCVGTLEYRKGFDTFADFARFAERSKGNPALQNAHFIWVGSSLGEKKIVPATEKASKLENITMVPNVTIGTLSNIYRQSDLYFFTSRNDPMPYAVIDALWHGLPVVGYRGVGGCDPLIDAFGQLLDDRTDMQAVANAIDTSLGEDGEARNKRAQHIKSSFDLDHYVCQLTAFLGDYNPKLNVVVPNYNHEKFLPIRLRSILSQTYRYFDLILLDDCSSDDSIEVMRAGTKDFANFTTEAFNETNSGNSYLQWKKAFELSENELVWIAESDDLCSATFLENMITGFADPEVKIAYAHTQFIDESGKKLGVIQDEFKPINPILWNKSYIAQGRQDVFRCLAQANTMINVSSVLFRASAVESFDNILKYRFAGDWELYLRLCAKGKVFFCREATNYFRRSSVQQTSKFAYTEPFYREHQMILQTVLDLYGPACAEKTKATIRLHWKSKPVKGERVETYLQTI
ncbi:glycosyltransferase [Cohaesibacter intestini]|uniref:glycosyltransferase n=1 Tax=Cohaesibacter intestini TaxID=2211145 RepID=UPI0018E50ED9|nr:glycosyltransferase [Cohaesibacter intestini]